MHINQIKDGIPGRGEYICVYLNICLCVCGCTHIHVHIKNKHIDN